MLFHTLLHICAPVLPGCTQCHVGRLLTCIPLGFFAGSPCQPFSSCRRCSAPTSGTHACFCQPLTCEPSSWRQCRQVGFWAGAAATVTLRLRRQAAAPGALLRMLCCRQPPLALLSNPAAAEEHGIVWRRLHCCVPANGAGHFVVTAGAPAGSTPGGTPADTAAGTLVAAGTKRLPGGDGVARGPPGGAAADQLRAAPLQRVQQVLRPCGGAVQH